MKTFTNITALKEAHLQVGTRVSVKGYYTAGDGGGGEFDVVASGTEDSVVTFTLANGNYAVRARVEYVTPEMAGAEDGGDATLPIQRCIDYLHGAAGGLLVFQAKRYLVTTLYWKSYVYAKGMGFGTSYLEQIVGTNADIIQSANLGISDISQCGIRDVTILGNYMLSPWNSATNTLGNTSGGGIVMQAYACDIDVVLGNIAGIGCYMMEPNSSEDSSAIERTSRLRISGRDFGQEGLVVEGPNDWIVDTVFIGRAGILPRPAADTTTAVSALYGGAVDGVVFDGVNLEVGTIHTYANWSGTGFRTRNTCRLTKGGRIISESNRSQVYISSSTYGSAMFDVRNVSLLHPNWTESIPTYSYPDPEWDAVTIDAGSDFSCEVTAKRTVTSTKRVVGATAVVVNGSARVVTNYSNSTAPTGDAEAGSLYSGDGVVVSTSAKGGVVDANMTRVNGTAVSVLGEGSTVRLAVRDSTKALLRDSGSNSKRGNNISGSIVNCTTGFESVGTPASEVVCLSMEMDTGETAFTGDRPDVSRGQVWDISASVNNVGYATRKRLTASLSDAVTTEQSVTVTHNFLYTPSEREISFSVVDSATVTTTLEYCYLSSISSTTLTFVYKYSAAGATNQRLSIQVG